MKVGDKVQRKNSTNKEIGTVTKYRKGVMERVDVRWPSGTAWTNSWCIKVVEDER